MRGPDSAVDHFKSIKCSSIDNYSYLKKTFYKGEGLNLDTPSPRQLVKSTTTQESRFGFHKIQEQVIWTNPTASLQDRLF